MRLPKPVDELTEQEWDGLLFRAKDALAKMLGWTSYHTLRSKGSRAGFPDRTLFRDRIVFAELKRHGGKPTDEQVKWLDGLAAAGGEVYLWTPRDLDEVGQILGRRWTLGTATRRLADTVLVVPELRYADGTHWTPGSMWIPEVGRSDSVTFASAAVSLC